ncbi:Mannan polymerase complex subunit mnn9 [Phytophthora cinnamomi]|uniref:Mannan polymerase complex subunit mnn9 n=1 Tax=Phytophthora cinnamomi TaxID=4785 RepID=UPI00355A6E4E|nr:Mannan polymerase complex subunit mnn9 [Phytophthora cinnamomi]
MVSANLRFLEKMPPLRDYQRGRFGRRGGVDGGDGGASNSALWMRALEESMEETSFVTREAPTCAALVAPVPVPVVVDSRRSAQFVPVPVAVLGAGRVGGIHAHAHAPAAASLARGADEDAARRRRIFALQAARGGGKDDEARPATEGLAL